jgi:hypothetical protein
MRICLQLGKFTRILALIFSVAGPRCAADALTYNTEAVISGWSDHSWVLPSGIPGKVDTITATFNPTLNTTDFPSLDGLALPITFEFSGLTLTSYQSPAPKSLGYAVYTPTAPSAFEIHCGKEFWAIGAILSVRSEVDESYSDSIHTIASVALSAPGPRTSSIGLGFYSEIMTMTANSGVIDFDYWDAVSAFYEDIDGKGHLVGGGKILASAIPEPVTYSVFAGCLLLVYASARRRARRLATMPQG